MSMKRLAPVRSAALLIAALMIGCGGPESNTPVGAEQGPATALEPAVTAEAMPRTVLFIGTSLTAGLGLPEAQSFPLHGREVDLGVD